VNTVSFGKKKIKDNRFEGKTFVLTGTLPSFTRKEAEEIIKSFGGRLQEVCLKKLIMCLPGRCGKQASKS